MAVDGCETYWTDIVKKIAIYFVLQSHLHCVMIFPHDFAGHRGRHAKIFGWAKSATDMSMTDVRWRKSRNI